MKVTQENLPHSQVGLEIEVPAAEVKSYYEKSIQDLVKNANIPGFRKGKVPRQIILQRFGADRVKAMAAEDLMQKSMPTAVKQEAIPAIGNYQITSDFDKIVESFSTEKPLVFKGTVDVMPEVKVGDYTKPAVTAEETKIAENAVADFLLERQKEKATLVPVEGRGAQIDDIAVVDYSAKRLDGDDVEGATAIDAEFEMSHGKFIADLVDGMVGMKIDETKEILVRFPADYARQDLADAQINFTVTVKGLKIPELPALDDDFAKEISQEETMEALKTMLLENFTKEAADKTQASIDAALAEAVVEITELDPPETLIEQETISILEAMASQFSQYGMDVSKLFTKESIPKMKENCRQDALKNLKRSLGIAKIAELEKITVETNEVQARAFTIRKQLEGKADEDRLQAFVENDLINEKVMKFLQDRATVTLVPVGSLAKKEEDLAINEDGTIETTATTVAE
jgi:trigger factor